MKSVMARCVAEGKHLRWVGVKKENGMLTLNNRSVRRAIYEAKHGTLSKKKQVTAKCDIEDCVNPDCLISRTKKKAMQGVRYPMSRNLKVRESRRKNSKLTIEMVREIRASSEGHTEIERRLGIPRGQAYRVRKGLHGWTIKTRFLGLCDRCSELKGFIMTRSYAAIQLLRHGRLTADEFVEITGWSYKACMHVLSSLRIRGLIYTVRRGGAHAGYKTPTIYALCHWASVTDNLLKSSNAKSKA